MTNDNDGLSKGKNINFLRFLRENTFFLLKNLMNPDKIRCVIIHGFGGALSLKNRILFRGILPALVSPLSEDGNILVKETEKLVRWQLSQGVNGFYVCGSTGEGLLLEKKTREKLLEVVLDAVEGKVPVIAHIGAIDLPTTLELAGHAKRAGAAAISSIPPIYFQYGENEVIEYYKTIAAAAEIPLVMYGVGLANTKLTVSLVEKLMEVENIIGIKWTYPDYYSMGLLKMIHNGNINVINGPDEMLVCGLAIGADAGIGTTYNVMPGLFVKLYDAYQSGQVEEAKKLQQMINRVITVLIKYHAIASTKELLCHMGFDVGKCTRPLRHLSEEERHIFLDEVSGIIDFEQQKVMEDKVK